MKIKTIMAVAILALAAMSCRKGCIDESAVNYDEKAKRDDGNCLYQQEVTLKFTQNFNGENITEANFDTIAYTNLNGQKLSLTKLQYSISDIRFYTEEGDSIMIDTYHFVDLEDPSTSTKALGKFNPEKYTGIGFNFGFNEQDNVSAAYPELNILSWSWPDNIGGGYHQLKMEGRFIDDGGDTTSYQFHNGSATKSTTGVFEPNYFLVKLPDSEFELSATAEIEVKMNIAEWYENPNTWDLNTMHTMLMPNYQAQLMMSENGKSVFSLGEIEQ